MHALPLTGSREGSGVALQFTHVLIVSYPPLKVDGGQMTERKENVLNENFRTTQQKGDIYSPCLRLL